MDRSAHIQPSALTVAAIKRVRLVLSARRGLRLKSSGDLLHNKMNVMFLSSLYMDQSPSVINESILNVQPHRRHDELCARVVLLQVTVPLWGDRGGIMGSHVIFVNCNVLRVFT